VLHLKLLQIILSAIFAVFVIALLLLLRESGLRYLILDHYILDMMIALMMLRGSYHLLTLNVIIIDTPKQSTGPGSLSVDLTR